MTRAPHAAFEQTNVSLTRPQHMCLKCEQNKKDFDHSLLYTLIFQFCQHMLFHSLTSCVYFFLLKDSQEQVV